MKDYNDFTALIIDPDSSYPEGATRRIDCNYIESNPNGTSIFGYMEKGEHGTHTHGYDILLATIPASQLVFLINKEK